MTHNTIFQFGDVFGKQGEVFHKRYHDAAQPKRVPSGMYRELSSFLKNRSPTTISSTNKAQLSLSFPEFTSALRSDKLNFTGDEARCLFDRHQQGNGHIKYDEFLAKLLK